MVRYPIATFLAECRKHPVKLCNYRKPLDQTISSTTLGFFVNNYSHYIRIFKIGKYVTSVYLNGSDTLKRSGMVTFLNFKNNIYKKKMYVSK